MSALKGDFISFSFNGVHSSELGIIRTSDGSRFNENLLPTIQDKTVQVPGGDGTYFFGSYYTQRPFNVPIAFDSLTEEQVRRLYSHFGDKQIHELIFDERPYKYYMAKITGTPQIKTICFEVDGQRIYKGEGILNFICYYPFAKSRFKYLDDFSNLKIKVKESGEDKEYTYANFYNNLNEWKETSRMKPTKTGYDEKKDGVFDVFNAGDFETDFKVFFPVNTTGAILSLNNMDAALKFSDLIKQGDDAYVCFNSKTNLLEGYAETNTYYPTTDTEKQPGKTYYEQIWPGDFKEVKGEFSPNTVYYTAEKELKPSSNLYNKHIIAGDFFKLPIGGSVIHAPNATKIEYDYLYI